MRRRVAQVLFAKARLTFALVALAQANVVDDEVVDDELLGAHPPDPLARWKSKRLAAQTRIDHRAASEAITSAERTKAHKSKSKKLFLSRWDSGSFGRAHEKHLDKHL